MAPTHAPGPFSAPSPSSVPHICPSCMPHNFRSSPMTQLPTHLILQYPLPHQYGPSTHIDTNCFPWNYQNAYTVSPPSFVPRSNLNLNAKPQPQPKPKTIPTHQPVQHPHQAPPQPVAQPLGVANTNIDNNPFPVGVGC